MASPITPASPPTIVDTFNGPDNGDPAVVSTVNDPFTALLTNTSALQLLTYGGGLRRRVYCQNDTTMTILPLGAVVVKAAGAWTVLEHLTASSVSPLALAGGSFTNNTRYWIYAFESGGAIDFVAQTTGPDDGLRYKDAGGTDTHFYVTTFYTDGAGAILPYSQDDNQYFYATQNGTPTGNGILISATGSGNVSVLGPVPAGARDYTLSCFLANGGMADGSALIENSANTVKAARLTVVATSGQGVGQQARLSMEDGSFDYNITIASDPLTVHVMGFTY